MAVPGTTSVVICTRNRAGVLDRCLATLVAVDGIEVADVLVVDNGSMDDTPAVVDRWAEKLPVLRYVHEPATGLSRARNTGLDRARGEVVAFLDDDVLVSPGWLAGLTATVHRWMSIDGVAGRVELDWPVGRPSWLPARREVWFAKLDLGPEPRLLTGTEYPVGANMAVRREVALAAGGFDPTLGYAGGKLLGNEERDLVDRIRAGGGQLAYAPEARVRHVVEGDKLRRRYLFRRLYDQGRSDVRADGRDDQRLLGTAKAALSRAVLRGWRHDLRRIADPAGRDEAVVDVVAGRAKQLGVAREALASAVGKTLGRP